uniref:Uncharacterized protein n=1 Tax=Romanomermis culicivorax TaxID=13658 RepID=A0A915JGQ3_ROMCU
MLTFFAAAFKSESCSKVFVPTKSYETSDYVASVSRRRAWLQLYVAENVGIRENQLLRHKEVPAG